MSEHQYEYFAFISYSRKDSRAARWLQRRIEWFRFPVNLTESPNRPPHPRYVRPVYRDKTNLEVDQAPYGESIRTAIEQSRFLLVLCSPHSARSELVDKEVRDFLSSRTDAVEYIVPVILCGNVGSGDAEECLCPALRSLGPQITDRNLPTMVPDAEDSEKEGWENGFIGVAAYLLKLTRDAVADHYQTEKTREVRRKRLTIGLVVVLALAGLFAGFFALRKERQAIAERKAAQASERKAIAAQQQQRATALESSESFAKQAVAAAEFYRWDEAEQRANDAEKVCPDGPWGLYARGRFAQLRNDHEKAVAILRKATELDPRNTVVKAALAQSTKSLKQIEAARKLAEQGGTTGDWQSLERLGESMMSLEKWREAEVAFGGALRSAEQPTNIPPDDKKKNAERIGNRHGEAKAWIACEGFYDSIRKLPAEEQVRRIEAKLSEVNGQAIKLKAEIKDGKWLGADLVDQPVRYLAPLKGMPLTSLNCQATKVSDLGPLKGMPLTSLSCRLTAVSDLSSLKGMPLTTLSCDNTQVSDLSPLKGMPLTQLHCCDTQVSDLSPLKGMPLTSLNCGGTQVSDLSPLKGMPLTSLNCGDTGVSDLGLLKGMPLTTLNCDRTRVSDLRPLEGMKLEAFTFTPKSITKGVELVRGMKTMREIGDHWTRFISPEAFWKKYDAGEFK